MFGFRIRRSWVLRSHLIWENPGIKSPWTFCEKFKMIRLPHPDSQYFNWGGLRAQIEEKSKNASRVQVSIFIGPESDLWECLSLPHSLTHWLTHSCLVNLIDVSLACEDGNLKLVEVVNVTHVDDEKSADYSLVKWSLVIILVLMLGCGYEV